MDPAPKSPQGKVNQLSSSDYEHIGRAIEAVVSSGYTKKRRLVAVNFLRGLVFGLGATLGLSIVLAAILYLLTFFSDLPFVGRLFEKVEQQIEQTRAE